MASHHFRDRIGDRARDALPRSLAWARSLAAAVFALILVGSSGCSDGGGGSDQDSSVSPVLDTSRQTSALIGPAGGSLEAVASDGTEFSLAIPPDALVEETAISLTPILAIEDLPMSGGLVAGVHFEPSGLELFLPATLTVTLPAAAVLRADEVLAGFTYNKEGENLELVLVVGDGDSFALSIDHFSGGGSGAAAPLALEAEFASGTPDAFLARLLTAIENADARAAESILRSWYEDRVRPRLQAAVSDDVTLERALREYQRWLNAEGAISLPIDLGSRLAESQALAAAALDEAIARANDLCARRSSFVEAEQTLIWQRRAESVLPEDVLLANGLDRSSVLDGLCVQVVFESTSFPAAPVLGEPALLEVVVGFAFDDGPTEFSSGMAVYVLTIGTDPAGATEVTDASGLVELTLTPNGTSIEIEVDACIGIAVGAFALTGASVCQEAFIVRGLVVSPASVTLAPGASQQFSALFLGLDEPVTWSATGGTIDPNGLFTADDLPGTFSVTATSIDDPGLVATARVTIDGDPVEPTTTAWLGTAQCFDVDRLGPVETAGIAVIQTGSQLEIHLPRVDLNTGERPFGFPCVSDDVVYFATLEGGSFNGLSEGANDCVTGPCPISGNIDGDTISGRVVFNLDCECYTDFEATIDEGCVVLSSGSNPLRMSCN